MGKIIFHIDVNSAFLSWSAVEKLKNGSDVDLRLITMIDNGRFDEKIIAIPFNDPNYNQYKGIDELPKHIFDEMAHFFKVYKNLENKDTAVNEVQGRDEAIKIINASIDHYIESFCK